MEQTALRFYPKVINMPDIAMCANLDCPMRVCCYRFRAVPLKHQTYSNFAPDERGLCSYFYPFEGSGRDVRAVQEIEAEINQDLPKESALQD